MTDDPSVTTATESSLWGNLVGHDSSDDRDVWAAAQAATAESKNAPAQDVPPAGDVSTVYALYQEYMAHCALDRSAWMSAAAVDARVAALRAESPHYRNSIDGMVDDRAIMSTLRDETEHAFYAQQARAQQHEDTTRHSAHSARPTYYYDDEVGVLYNSGAEVEGNL